MAFSLNGVSKFLKGLSFLDGFGLVESGINLVLTIFDYAREDWTEEPSNTEVLDKIAALSDKIDTVAPAIIGAVNDLVNDQAIGIRMQQLASALSGAQSARDLLASYQPGDELMRNAIIVEASGAFRDTLAQAVAIITPTEFYKPSFAAVNTVMASVFQALSTRLAVASVLENDELAANKVANQMQDAAAFFENAIDVYRGVMETKVASYTIDASTGKSLYTFIVELDIEPADVPTDLDGTVEPGDPYRLERTLQAFQFSNSDDYLKAMEKELQDEVFQDLNMGLGGSSLSQLALSYNVLAAGVEKTLPLRIGYDSSGTLEGTGRNDLLIGNVGDDTLKGKGGNDLLRGKAGDDTLKGGKGNDRLIGGDGNDNVFGQDGNDALEGNGGNDTIYGDGIFSGASDATAMAIAPQGYDQARFYGKLSEYTITHVSSIATPVAATDPLNPSYAYTTRIRVFGPDGADIVIGVEELVFDDARVLVTEGTSASETITGKANDDFIFGWDGNDHLNGLGGNDTIRGDHGDDTIIGGDGDDFLSGGSGKDNLFGSAGNDRLVGDSGNDRLKGEAGNDRLQGDDGNDRLIGNGGNDQLDGGAGRDKLFGRSGKDLLEGGKQKDLLSGGTGNDVLTGGSGADKFVFERNMGKDKITDFTKGSDVLQLDERLWTASSGVLSASEVLTQFATDTGADIVLDFGAGNIITLQGVASLTGLETDLLIV